ncbi:ceramide glucosyltransferase [Methylocystis sp. JAN1]|uniref:ceramide glucosyltransferase n=1 Tax=Methylocystis sp. JAN1 TaxID=3397211 RepID=UPI003FA3069A
MTLAYVCAGWCAFILVMNFASMWLMGRKCRARERNLPVPDDAPWVSIVRPLRGIETFSEETLRATFELDYPHYEIIFCVQSTHDPIIPLVERVIADYPGHDARLLVGDDYVSANPKLNNCVKGWEAARYEYVILADSNALPPRDYVQTMLAAFEPDTAMTVSMPIGSRTEGFWALVECAILNTFQARWQYGAEAIGAGFAQGKNMMWRREVLDRAGGIRALGCEIAEDAASTKIIRAQGMTVRLVDMPFEQPLGARTAHEVYSRHVRWARLRRVTFPAHYAPEFMNGSFVAVVLGAYAALEFGGDAGAALLAATAVMFALHLGEIRLARVCGFALDWRMPFALITRDLMLPVMFVDALLFDDFVWHGNAMTVREVEDTAG